MSSSVDIVNRLAACPIIQAPMAGVSTAALAAAVSNAGALGSIAIGAGSVQAGRQSIQDTRALTPEPFNVNVFCHAPAPRSATRESAWLRHFAPVFETLGATPPTTLEVIYRSFVEDEDAFRMLLAERPAVVSFHFGVPRAEQVAAFKAAGTYTLATATCLEEARLIERAGVDAIVAQGIEAGGHRGMFDPDVDDERLSTAVLVRLLVRRTALPVIAAGGIMDGQGVRAALSLGALAAQLGTAFVACPESSASASHRARLLDEASTPTRMTSVVSGRPARGFVNALIRHGEAAGSPLPAGYPVAYDLAKQLHAAAVERGSHDYAAQWAGQGAALARALPAAELVSVLRGELAASANRARTS